VPHGTALSECNCGDVEPHTAYTVAAAKNDTLQDWIPGHFLMGGQALKPNFLPL
jgi:hypothetical protein